MRTSAAILLLLTGLAGPAGCGDQGRSCGRCETRVVQPDADRRPSLAPRQCTVHGVEIDCRKYHASCPDCSTPRN